MVVTEEEGAMEVEEVVAAVGSATAVGPWRHPPPA